MEVPEPGAAGSRRRRLHIPIELLNARWHKLGRVRNTRPCVACGADVAGHVAVDVDGDPYHARCAPHRFGNQT